MAVENTYQGIQDQVTRRVIDLPAAVTTEVSNLVNKAVRKIQRRHNFKIMEAKTAALVTTLATRVLAAVPSDYKEGRDRPYEILNDGTTRRLVLAPSRDDIYTVFTDSDPNDKGAPKVILDAEGSNDDGIRNFEVWPFPDGNSDFTGGEYRIVVPYWKYVANMVNATDSNWFTVNAEDWVVFTAASEAFFLDWDEERGTVWAQKAVGEFRDVVRADKLFRLATMDTLVPSRDVHGPRLRG